MRSTAVTNRHLGDQPTPLQQQPCAQLRQIAGLTAGTTTPLPCGDFRFGTGQDDPNGFSLRVGDDFSVIVIPGPSGILLDTDLVTRPSPLAGRTINAVTARFRVEGIRQQRPSRELILAGPCPALIDPVVQAISAPTSGPSNLATRLRRAQSDVALQRRQQHPDPEEINWKTRSGRNQHWRRRSDHWNLSQVSIANADLAWLPRIDQPHRLSHDDQLTLSQHSVLPSVPVIADLGVGPLGIVGPRAAALACTRQVMTNFATMSPPSQTAITVLADSNEHEDWSWAHALPHTNQAGSSARPLIVVDGLKQMDDAGFGLALGPNNEANVVVLATTRSELPPSCAVVMQLHNDATATIYNYRDGWTADRATPQGISDVLASQIAHRLAQLAVLSDSTFAQS